MLRKCLKLLCIYTCFILFSYVKNNKKNSFQHEQDFCRQLNKPSITIRMKDATNWRRWWDTGWPKSHAPERKLNISTTTQANVLIFLSTIEPCLNFISIKTHLDRSFVKYHYWFKYHHHSLTFTYLSVLKICSSSSLSSDLAAVFIRFSKEELHQIGMVFIEQSQYYIDKQH